MPSKAVKRESRKLAPGLDKHLSRKLRLRCPNSRDARPALTRFRGTESLAQAAKLN